MKFLAECHALILDNGKRFDAIPFVFNDGLVEIQRKSRAHADRLRVTVSNFASLSRNAENRELIELAIAGFQREIEDYEASYFASSPGISQREYEIWNAKSKAAWQERERLFRLFADRIDDVLEKHGLTRYEMQIQGLCGGSGGR